MIPTPDPSERGAALLLAIFSLLIVTALSTALLTSGRTEQMISANQERAAQARGAAEAGLNYGTAVLIANLQNWNANGFANPSAAMTGILRGPDNAIGSTQSDADNGSLETFGIPRPPARATLSAAANTAFEVRVLDEDDPARGLTLSAADRARIGENGNALLDGNSRVLVRAIGYADGGTITRLEATISPLMLPAIVTNSHLTISGNPTIAGANGSVHSNANLQINGGPTISGDVTATGTYTGSNSASIGGEASGGRPPLDIPPVHAIDYRPQADFILTSTGLVENQAGALLCNASSNASACQLLYGWEFDGSNGWKIGGNIAVNGTFYVEGDARISGSPGSNLLPLVITIIATGNIEISGNPDLRPDSPDLMFVTDKDLKIGGNLEQTVAFEGTILVREQLMISGNPSLAGQILVEDAANLSSMVTNNTISGNPTIVSNGLVGSTTYRMSAWREVR